MQGPLSDETNQLLDKLHHQPTGWRARFRRDDLASIIEQVGQSGEPLAVPSLLGFAFEKNEATSRAAGLAIQSLIAGVPPLDLAFLDQHVRQFGPWSYGRTRVAEVNPKDVQELGPSVGVTPFVLGLASFHRDGYVREAATRALARVSSGAEVPFLLIRANDWVAQVREVASEALQARISEGQVAAFVRSLPLVARLRDCGRANHDELADSVEQLLGNGEADEELFEGFHSKDRFTRRACARIAVVYQRAHLCERALSTSDSIVRVFSAKYLLAELPTSAACQLSARLADDRFMAIRQEALRAALERCSESLRERLEVGLLDRSLSVRKLAGYYAKKRFDIDLAGFYRSRLPSSSGRMISACIVGLGEHGQKEDALDLVSYVTDGTPRARRSAVRAIANLDFESHVELMTDAIRSVLPGVSREASLVLQRCHASVAPTFLEDLLLNDPHAHVRRNAFRVLDKLGKWPSLKYALLAVASPDEDLVSNGVQALDRWAWSFNRSYAQPTPSEVEEISALLDSPCLQIPAERVRALRGCLPKPGS